MGCAVTPPNKDLARDRDKLVELAKPERLEGIPGSTSTITRQSPANDLASILLRVLDEVERHNCVIQGTIDRQVDILESFPAFARIAEVNAALDAVAVRIAQVEQNELTCNGDVMERLVRLERNVVRLERNVVRLEHADASRTSQDARDDRSVFESDVVTRALICGFCSNTIDSPDGCERCVPFKAEPEAERTTHECWTRRIVSERDAARTEVARLCEALNVKQDAATADVLRLTAANVRLQAELDGCGARVNGAWADARFTISPANDPEGAKLEARTASEAIGFVDAANLRTAEAMKATGVLITSLTARNDELRRETHVLRVERDEAREHGRIVETELLNLSSALARLVEKKVTP